MPKLGIIYICTGKYKIFWKDFYLTSEKYFWPECEKNYYVFSDDLSTIEQKENIKLYYHPKIDWPMISLTKWLCTCEIQEELIKCDYAAFCNANLLFIKELHYKEFQQKFILTYFNRDKEKENFTLEQNPKSMAYIPNGEKPEHYIRGGLFIGKSEDFVKAARTMRDWTALDYKKGIIPIWHDESQLNAYVCKNKVSVRYFDYQQIMPEEYVKDGMPTCAIFRAKSNYGGNDFMRGIKIPLKQKAKLFAHKIKGKLKRIINSLKSKYRLSSNKRRIYESQNRNL